MKRAFFILITFALCTACSKNQDVQKNDSCIVNITTSIEDGSVQTKAYDFGDNDQYGIFVCMNGSTTARHKSNSWNMRARYYYGNWYYYYLRDQSGSGNTSDTPYEHLTLTAREDGVTADLYAYAPYNIDAYSSGPAAVPFTLGPDYMYAVENTYPESDPLSNKGLDPSASSGVQSAQFTFRHIFSKLFFRFRLKNTPSNYTVYKIIVYLRDPDGDGNTTAHIYTNGTFNITTGNINAGATPRDSLIWNISYPYLVVNSTTNYNEAYIYMVPTDVADDELEVQFVIEDQTTKPFKIKREYLLHNDGVTYGFQAGYRYYFDFTIDNYVYFDGFTISDSWDSDELGSQEI